MADDRTPEEVRARHVETMGEALGLTFDALYQDIVWLHARWAEFRKLFGKSPERIAILNESAPYFFHLIQDTLFEDVVLHIARVTDSERSCGRDNLTLQRLPRLVEDAALRTEVDVLLAVALDASAFARAWRNRRLAHRDLVHAIEPDGEPLAGISRAMIEESLAAIRALMNKLELHYLDATTAYDFFLVGPGDADSLVRLLHRACVDERARRDRIRSRTASREDFDHLEEV